MKCAMKVTLRTPHVDRLNGTARYGLALAPALRALGHDVRVEEEWKLELRLGTRWMGGNVSAKVARLRPPHAADVVHATTAFCNPRRAAHIVTVHDIMPITHPHLYGLTREQALAGTAPMDRALERHILVDVQHTKAEILREFPRAEAQRIHVVPLAADAQRFFPEAGAAVQDPAFTRGRLNVLAVMSPERRKRLDLLLAAALALPFVHVVHVGARPAPPGHQAAHDAASTARAQLETQGRYVPLADVDDARLRRLLSGADVVVHPSEAEGFGLPPLEALACGARVIASDIPPHREILGDAVRYVTVDEAALVRELEAAWDGQAVRDERFAPLQQRLAQAHRYTWERTARETVQAYAAATRA